MKDARDYIEELARGRVVETIAGNLTGVRELTPDLRDLCGNVYLILLTYDPDKVRDLGENGELRYFIVRILRNQMKTHSEWYKYFRRYQRMATPIEDVITKENRDD